MKDLSIRPGVINHRAFSFLLGNENELEGHTVRDTCQHFFFHYFCYSFYFQFIIFNFLYFIICKFRLIFSMVIILVYMLAYKIILANMLVRYHSSAFLLVEVVRFSLESKMNMTRGWIAVHLAIKN